MEWEGREFGDGKRCFGGKFRLNVLGEESGLGFEKVNFDGLEM